MSMHRNVIAMIDIGRTRSNDKIKIKITCTAMLARGTNYGHSVKAFGQIQQPLHQGIHRQYVIYFTQSRHTNASS